ncbi:phosphomannomutase (plasmid) [Roseobacter denitrificans]|uniref:Phosphomannomutase n=1 Tax=Roseobacter denitrificans (strain ATCC 33942 / OCh 114) TaxID=375451 RepID=Q07GH4_ROSDO|nr:phosphomannomutase [Roseobacter denitrificans]ABI93425.1 phosphomannomutase [Roseobacter denitrificans OCh 114]AVL55099.1 phosphomannomutase [Roseobacter denitrificans]SFG44107.1 phosphomannomutase [Roseobacter denitrificans OCh 114]
MTVKFGTSGLRGLVTGMTPDLITAHVQSFLTVCDTGGILCVGQDLRPSSPRIAGDVMAAARAMGVCVIDCGALPTPALALAAQGRGAGAVMVTGSHIPADRNGLKFYTTQGEITKADEAAILQHLGETPSPPATPGTLETDTTATQAYVARYVSAFGAAALSGRRIGVYTHSAVGRDDLMQILNGLGAEVVELGRSAHFIPVDTEAVDPDTRAQIVAWVQAHGLDALVSTDGDSDRPLLADETGRVVPGDILGQITAQALAAEVIATPISSNSGVTQKGFKEVKLTQIGSPYVIAAMEEAQGRVIGYEANGGFLLGFDAMGPAGPLPALVTRDCTLPILMTLYAGRDGIAARVAQEPPVVTVADRLQNVEQDKSRPLLAKWQNDPTARAAFLAGLGKEEKAMDLTDGLRMTLTDGDIIHIRPSGNAPELRVYIETNDASAAQTLLASTLAALKHAF